MGLQLLHVMAWGGWEATYRPGGEIADIVLQTGYGFATYHMYHAQR